jgi:ribonuclease P protein component
MSNQQNIYRFKFKKKNRLKSRKTIELLFRQNRMLKLFPLKLVYTFQPGPFFNAKVAFVASRKNFKHAVDRNRIKRMVREAYRLNASILTNSFSNKPLTVAFMFIYQADSETPFRELEMLVKKLLLMLAEKIEKEQPEIFL